MRESRARSTTMAGLLLQTCVVLVCSTSVSAQTVHRVQSVGDNLSDLGRAIAVDSAGNSYVTGQFSGTVDFGPQDTLTAAGTADMFVAKYDSLGKLEWVRQAGGALLDAGIRPRSIGHGIAVAGNEIYITGTFIGKDVFGILTSLSVDGDFFIAQYDSTGTFKNAIQAGGTSHALGAAPNSVNGLGIAAVDFGTIDDVYVTGVFSGTVNFGLLTKTETFACSIAAGSCLHGDLFVAKYSGLSASTPVWFQQAGGSGSTDRASGHGIAVDDFGVYVVGTFRGTAAFPGGPAAPAFGGDDVLVAKLNAGNGSVATGWPKGYGSTSDDAGYGIAVSPDGLTGNSTHITGSFGFGSFASLGVATAFLVKLDGSTGNAIWARGAEPPPLASTLSQATATSIGADADGNSYVTGLFSTQPTTPNVALTLDTTTGTGVRASVGDDLFTFSDVGKRIYHNTSAGIARIVAVISASVVVVDILEDFASTSVARLDWSLVPEVNFAAPGDASAFLSALGFSDMFTAAYDTGGHLRWINQAQSEIDGAAAGSGIAVDVDGSVHVVGSYRGELTFGRGYEDGVPVSGPLELLPAAGAEEDIFVAKYGGNTPIGNNIVVTLEGGEGITGIVLTFDTVTSAGATTVSYTSASPDCPAPTGFQLVSACLLIETTAAFSGSVKIEVHYDQSALGLSDADEPLLTFRHWDSQQPSWEVINDVTVSPNPDTTQDVIYGVTTGFSPFALTLPATPELDHIDIAPVNATINVGGSQAYTVQAIDQFGNSLGDVTAATTFSISPDGSCTGATCTAIVAGTHSVTATYNGKPANATLEVTGVTPSTYTFQGFFAPIDMSTDGVTVLNAVKAGQAVPVKWLLTVNGSPVADAVSFAEISSYPISCTSGSGSVEDAIEQAATGASGLQYIGSGNWQYNWKTLQSYKGTCRAMVVKFSDGTSSPPAAFKFDK